ncbi:MAG: hypothetical protein HYY20_02215 [Candidatus Tectomicrobia bacterium]|uniref:Uncharacterized protein n=1 Tax=Tectimicrobiota bacterium TaxID=2528274 RepID=A0A932CLT5_UNCTE|nr:hypothetical protein [Candidatus Tectomicrobia bacterium]
MGEKVSIEALAEAIYQCVAQYAGKRRFSPTELTKEMITQHGSDRVTKQDCKEALRVLIDSGRCIYTYYGGTSVELPPKEE